MPLATYMGIYFSIIVITNINKKNKNFKINYSLQNIAQGKYKSYDLAELIMIYPVFMDSSRSWNKTDRCRLLLNKGIEKTSKNVTTKIGYICEECEEPLCTK